MSRWENLANAIIEQAVLDLKDPPLLWDAEMCTEEAIEDFFNSRWFGVLSDLDGPELFKRAKQMIKAQKSKQAA